MLRILIPSDNQDFVSHLARAYAGSGCEVTVGQFNFDLRTAAYDVVHVQWPEELTGWRPPSEERLGSLLTSLEQWASGAKVVLTVHNLYPHCYEGEALFSRLLDGSYRRATVIHHFSNASRELVCREFPGARGRQHIVTTPFNYDSLLPARRDRPSARRKIGLADDEIAVLIFGELRTWKELELVRRGFAGANVRGLRLVMAGRYHERRRASVWQQRYRRWSWSAWLRRNSAIRISEYVRDDEIHQLFDAADVVVVPRLKDELSSGIPSLAMTFGKLVIAPRHGAFPDYLAGSGNLLYESGDWMSLARAIETAATLDRDAIGRENRRIADGWSWDKIVVECLDACFRQDTRLDRGGGSVALAGGGAGASRTEPHRHE